MSTSDDELEGLLRRTRARRELINARKAAWGEQTVPIRSPLREINSETSSSNRDRSPLKNVTSTTTTTTTTSRSGSPPTKTSTTRFASSPSKSSIDKLMSASPSKASLDKLLKSSMSTPGTSQRREEETFNREVTSTKTTIVGDPKLSPKGRKETITKTTITETEEKFEKKEVYKFTEVRKGGSKSPLRDFDDRFDSAPKTPTSQKNREDIVSVKTPASSMTTVPEGTNKRVIETKTVTFKNSPIVKTVFTHDDEESSSNEETSSQSSQSPTMGSPSRFGSCRDLSPESKIFSRRNSTARSRTPSPTKLITDDKYSKKTDDKFSTKTTPEKSFSNVRSPDNISTPSKVDNDNDDDDCDDDDSDLETARRKRLQALASKFKVYDDDDNEGGAAKSKKSATLSLATAAASSSPSRRDRTKVVDVDKEIHRMSSATKNLAGDSNFLNSLKAQGFEETQSKTKLVYDFSNRSRCDSPTKRVDSPARDQSQSPYKLNPHQFIAPLKSSPIPPKPPTTPASTYRSCSPTRMVSSPARPTSPFKPHPLQFVSPLKAAEAAALAKAEPEGPPKPARTYVTSARKSVTSAEPEERSKPEVPTKTWRTEKTVTVTPVTKSPAKSPSREAQNLTDTASRKSLLEKRNLFDNQSGSPAGQRTPDPAMLPMSERRKLFEKNQTAPKPIARFGESVTPAMLSKGQPSITPNVRPPPMTSMTEPAWKRRRETSPVRTFATPNPAPRRSPPKLAVSPSEPLSKRFDRSRRLFEQVNDDDEDEAWRENEIAKKHEQQREKDMQVLLNRFNNQKSYLDKPANPPSTTESEEASTEDDEVETKMMSARTSSPSRVNYPGVGSLKKIKVSPPKPGQLYPDLEDIQDERPDTAMSGESFAPSEAPSLGTSIKRVASQHRREEHLTRMTTISEDADSEDEEMEFSTMGNQINDMLDEALDDSQDSQGPTPPKLKRRSSKSPTRRGASSPSGTSAASWEYEATSSSHHKDFKTPRIDGLSASPQAPLPMLYTDDGPTPGENLMHTVSFYRKSKPVQVNVTPARKIVRNATPIDEEERHQDEIAASKDFNERIGKLQEDIGEQMQRRLQASKALDICQSKEEFEGSSERVEFERLLLEAHHKHAASTAEINRLKSEGAKSGLVRKDKSGVPLSRGTLTISGLSLQLKSEFVKMISTNDCIYEDVHYFVCLVKYRSQVIATQMLSTMDGISRGDKLNFTNLININDLDFDFRIYLEVYGLQTPREHLSHEAKYHIRKEKSMFNLTPLKKLKKQDSRFVGSRHENPVNNLTIRKPKFGLVGYTTITIDTLAKKKFRLENVPKMSPLEGGLEMKLAVHSESRIEESGFLTVFMEINGLGNWCRRWCRLQDNTLFFWKYPDDEEKNTTPCFQISLHNCVTENVTLAPREICARMNTFMLENQRPIQHDDRDSQNVHVDVKQNVTNVRHLLMADTRDERIHWCGVLNKALETLRAWDPTSAKPRCPSQTSSYFTSDEETGSTSSSTVIW